ncbi:replication-associated recombination protein A [Thermosyntropha sp.]|uniref:replication-associated recombination protein A n=1 Tax=Thermosyntropha sp. TaxID=2740820 RepID=UPI0025CCE92D|nr:replication-associated recombination protein A [Thermosyntropha sp.]MBO8159819.1 replication-associated recombination protein A [Thermosyntropha sp.]
MDLFSFNQQNNLKNVPLAYRMRPKTLDEIIGQKHILGKNSVLRQAIEKDNLHSFVLYGPPGTGKTSIASIIAKITKSHFEKVQAVTAGVSDIKKIAFDAKDRLKYYNQKTILFLDEIHRFNKSQQDVLLPFIEDGTLILIGATTENPLYELNNALLSRLKLYILEPLNEEEIHAIIIKALTDKKKGLGHLNITIEKEALARIVQIAKGDGRMALNILEAAVNSYLKPGETLTEKIINKVTPAPFIKYDKTGDYHYDTISAFIKSIRGSDPDAAVFWLAVMLEGGEDPKFIARRLIIHAAEDIGLADPQALVIAAAAAKAVEFVGMPEARIPLAEAAIYLATAPKSNRSYLAINEAINTVKKMKKIKVPSHLASADHSRARELLGKGTGYKYPHDYGGYVEQQYLPDEIKDHQFYIPSEKGYEAKIFSFLSKIKS